MTGKAKTTDGSPADAGEPDVGEFRLEHKPVERPFAEARATGEAGPVELDADGEFVIGGVPAAKLAAEAVGE